jgi:hypothetical protein
MSLGIASDEIAPAFNMRLVDDLNRKKFITPMKSATKKDKGAS